MIRGEQGSNGHVVNEQNGGQKDDLIKQRHHIKRELAPISLRHPPPQESILVSHAPIEPRFVSKIEPSLAWKLLKFQPIELLKKK